MYQTRNALVNNEWHNAFRTDTRAAHFTARRTNGVAIRYSLAAALISGVHFTRRRASSTDTPIKAELEIEKKKTILVYNIDFLLPVFIFTVNAFPR